MADHFNDEMLSEIWDDSNFSSESDIDNSDSDYQPESTNKNIEESNESSDDSDSQNSEDSEGESTDESAEEIQNDTESNEESHMEINATEQIIFDWTKDLRNFQPKMALPASSEPVILTNVDRSTTKLDTFLQK